jgi:hypothetical protein
VHKLITGNCWFLDLVVKLGVPFYFNVQVELRDISLNISPVKKEI